MTKHSDLVHPTHCFCQISDEELRPWAIKRYEEHLSTMQLLHSTDDLRQKEIISIVAMLDVDEDSMLELMGDVNLPDHHIVHCRKKVKKMLGLPDNPEEST